MKAATASSKDDGKKLVLPDVIPGFKASSLEVAIPPKVEEAFRRFQYVPYTALTTAARLKAAQGEENFTINAQGGLTAKGLDRRNEKSISIVDWYAASTAAEGRIREHFGEARATALAAHHRIVMDLGRSHNWETAMEYDVSQCEMVALRPAHDLSTLDIAALAIIATRPPAKPTPQSFLSVSPSKRPIYSDHLSTPRKWSKNLCFRCGGAGHLPPNCKAEFTTAGRKTAPVAPSSKSGNALLAPNGKYFCFNWSRNSGWHFGDACAGFHGCSLCGEPSHGAGSCKSCA